MSTCLEFYISFFATLTLVFAQTAYSQESQTTKSAICKCTTKSTTKCYINAFSMEISSKKVKFERLFEGKAGNSKTIAGQSYITFDGFAYLDPHYIFQLLVAENFSSKKSFQTILSATGEKTFHSTFNCKFSK